MEELLEILSDMKPEVDFEEAKDLVEEGYLTSFDLVMLISRISQEMDVTIPANEIVPENFQSVETIYALIKRLDEE